jgi:hypothetical protein
MILISSLDILSLLVLFSFRHPGSFLGGFFCSRFYFLSTFFLYFFCLWFYFLSDIRVVFSFCSRFYFLSDIQGNIISYCLHTYSTRINLLYVIGHDFTNGGRENVIHSWRFLQMGREYLYVSTCYMCYYKSWKLFFSLYVLS